MKLQYFTLLLLFNLLITPLSSQDMQRVFNTSLSTLDDTEATAMDYFKDHNATLFIITPSWINSIIFKFLKDKERLSVLEEMNVNIVILEIIKRDKKEADGFKSYWKRNNINYPVLIEKGFAKSDPSSSRKSNIHGEKVGDFTLDKNGFPYAFLVNRQGEIIAKDVFSELTKQIVLEKYLSGPPELKFNNAFQNSPNQVIIDNNQHILVSSPSLRARWWEKNHQFAVWKNEKWNIPSIVLNDGPHQLIKTVDNQILAVGNYTKLIDSKTDKKIKSIQGALEWKDNQWQTYETPMLGEERLFVNGADGHLYVYGYERKTIGKLYRKENNQWVDLNFPTGKGGIGDFVVLSNGNIYATGAFQLYSPVEHSKALADPSNLTDPLDYLNLQHNRANLAKWDGQKWTFLIKAFHKSGTNIYQVGISDIGLTPEGFVFAGTLMNGLGGYQTSPTYGLFFLTEDEQIVPIANHPLQIKIGQFIVNRIFEGADGEFLFSGRKVINMHNQYLARYRNQKMELISDAFEGGIISDVYYDKKTKEVYVVGSFKKFEGKKAQIVKIKLN